MTTRWRDRTNVGNVARAGDVIADRFRLEVEIGAGAMGTVWRATHLSLQAPVALKLIRAEVARHPEAHQRFEREAVIAARLNSAHVARAIDHGRHDGVPYIAIEFLAGETLRSRLDLRQRLTVIEAARVVRHVARALTAAHDAGLVHRDIKPENVFVAREDDEEIYKVLDFGVAKVTDELARGGIDPTRTGTLLGTPFYLSPEQARGLKTLDHRADLWSLGVMTFECLTGRRPFAGNAIGPLIAQILHGSVPSVVEWSGDERLPPELDGWMARALAREPSDRFGSAREMADAFNIAAGTGDSFPTAEPASYREPRAVVVFEAASAVDDLAATMALPAESDVAALGGTLALSEPVPGAEASSGAVEPDARDLPASDTEERPPAASSPAAPGSSSSATTPSRLLLVALLVVLGLAAAAIGYALSEAAAESPSPTGERSAPASRLGARAGLVQAGLVQPEPA